MPGITTDSDFTPQPFVSVQQNFYLSSFECERLSQYSLQWTWKKNVMSQNFYSQFKFLELQIQIWTEYMQISRHFQVLN